MNVLVSGRLADRVAALLQAATTAPLQTRAVPNPTAADLHWADVFTGFAWPAGVQADIGWIHAMGLGVDGFACAPTPALFTRTVGSMPLQMGRYVTGALFSFQQRHDELRDAQTCAEWAPVEPRGWPSRALILGTGLAAQGVSKALSGLGIHVAGVNRKGHPVAGFDRTVSLAQLADELRVPPCLVVNLLPLTEATRDLVDGAVFAALRGALFVSVGRGATVHEYDLRQALQDGSVAEAWLDVHRQEPLPRDDWAWSHPGVRITPHIAALTTADDVVADFFAALKARGAGERPATAIALTDYTGER